MKDACCSKKYQLVSTYGTIEEQQREYWVYTLGKRLSTFISLVLLVLIGCIVELFKTVIILNLGMLYLRLKVNEFHTKIFRECLILSIVFELITLL